MAQDDLNQLFRTEVIEAHEELRADDTLLQLAPSLKYYMSVILGMTVLAMVFGATASFDRKVKLRGVVVPAEGLVQLRAPIAGFISGLTISVGQSVKKGAPILSLHRNRIGDGKDDVDKTLVASLERQISAGEKAGAAEEHSYEISLEKLAKDLQIETLNEQSAQHRFAVAEELLSLNRAALDGLKDLLEEGYITKLQYTERLTGVQTALLEYESAKTSLKTISIRVETAKLTIDGARSRHAHESAHTQDQYEELLRRRSLRSIEARQVLVAESQTIVGAILKKNGEWAKSGEHLVTLIPNNSRLLVQLFAASNVPGQIEEGQRVRLAVDAFPSQRFGFLEGKVLSLHYTAERPNGDISSYSQAQKGYLIEVSLDREFLEGPSDNYSIRPGMDVQAAIIIEKRTIFQMIFEPLFSFRGRL